MKNSQGESWACRECERAFPNEATATLHPEFCEVEEKEVVKGARESITAAIDKVRAPTATEMEWDAEEVEFEARHAPPEEESEPDETVKQATLEGAPVDTFKTESEHNGYTAEQGVLI